MRSSEHTFAENLAAQKQKLEAEMAHLPPGPARDALASKIAQIDTAAHMDGWLRSELRAPT